MDFIYLLFFHLFQFSIRILPLKIRFFLIRKLAYLIYILDAKHRKIAFVNLDIAYGTTLSKELKDEIVRKSYENLLFNLADFIDNQGISKECLEKKVIFVNDHFLLNERAKGCSVVLMTAHYGNWELLSLAIAAKYGPLSVVGRPLDSTIMNTILKSNREQYNIEMLDKKGALKGMISAIRKGRLLGLLVDQNTAEKEGILIDFFGKKARHTPSVAILARKLNAIVIPVFISTKDHITHTITYYPPLPIQHSEDIDADIFAHVQSQAVITEQVIRAKPDEWFWLHQRWKNQYEYLYQ
ncbi:MAG: lipid A biosynthesis acyltransferase [Sulfuricurvum sp.]|nr:lipid A biosynthesis acyltransferase [Sulfuricurvum sp.]